MRVSPRRFRDQSRNILNASLVESIIQVTVKKCGLEKFILEETKSCDFLRLGTVARAFFLHKTPAAGN